MPDGHNDILIAGAALLAWYWYRQTSAATTTPVQPATGQQAPAGYRFQRDPITGQYHLVRIGTPLSGLPAPVTTSSTTFPPPAAPNGYYYSGNPYAGYQLRLNPLGGGAGTQQSLITALESGAGGLFTGLSKSGLFNNLFGSSTGNFDIGVQPANYSDSGYTGIGGGSIGPEPSYSYLPSDGQLPTLAQSNSSGISPIGGGIGAIRPIDTSSVYDGELLPVNDGTGTDILGLSPGEFASGNTVGELSPGSYSMNSLGAVPLGSGSNIYEDAGFFSSGNYTASGYY